MHIRQQGEFAQGYTPITEFHGKHSDMLMDFGILALGEGQEYSDYRGLERTFLLLEGDVELFWDNQSVRVVRQSLFDEAATVLHLPQNSEVRILAKSPSELALNAVPNKQDFRPVLYLPDDYRSEQFGANSMQDTALRTVRTIFDAATAEYSQMVLGEVLNYPGKWSSYPPHTHAQPEIYHFRFLPDKGFGFSAQGDAVYQVGHGDTVTISPQLTHPQVAAPGYCMYYLWAIPHLENDRFGPDSRNFTSEHAWLLEKQAEIWTKK